MSDIDAELLEQPESSKFRPEAATREAGREAEGTFTRRRKLGARGAARKPGGTGERVFRRSLDHPEARATLPRSLGKPCVLPDSSVG